MMHMKPLRSLAFFWWLTRTVDCVSDLSVYAVASGLQESHVGVESKTSAELFLEFDVAFTYASYQVNVLNGEGITHVHLHCAPAGESGPVVGYLFGFLAGGINVRRGKLSSGRFRNADILSNVTDYKNATGCGITINTIASLYHAVRKGFIYMNVHTLANPGGEARGQLFIGDDDEHDERSLISN